MALKYEKKTVWVWAEFVPAATRNNFNNDGTKAIYLSVRYSLFRMFNRVDEFQPKRRETAMASVHGQKRTAKNVSMHMAHIP